MSNVPENASNPFAVYSTALPPVSQSAGGIYRKGKLLVVHKMAQFPDRCIKSNEPTTERLKRKLMWHHPAVFLLILVNLLVYAIVALCIRKNATFQIPLAPRYKAARIKWMLLAWGMFFTSLAVFIGGIATADQVPEVITGICIGQFLFGILIPLLIGIYGCRVIYAKKIDDQYAWIAGSGNEFRKTFPEWPYPG